MNLLRLSKYVFSTKCYRELMLIVQLVCMFAFGFVSLQPIDNYFHSKKQVDAIYVIEDSKSILFSPGNAVEEKTREYGTKGIDTDTNISKAFLEVNGVENVYSFFSATSQYGKEKHFLEYAYPKVATVIGYSSEFRDKCKLPLKENADNVSIPDGYLPIFIGGLFPHGYSLGTTMYLSVGDTKTVIPCVIAGELIDGVCLPLAQTHGSNPTLSSIALFPNEIQQLNRPIIVAFFQSGECEYINKTSNYILELNQKADENEAVTKLNACFGSWGVFNSFSTIKERTFEKVIHDNYWCLFAFVLFVIIVIWGFGGYLYVTVKRKQKLFALLHIMGLTRNKQIAIYFVSTCSLIVASALLARVVAPWVFNVLLPYEIETAGPLSYLLCSVVILLSLIASTYLGFYQSRIQAEAAIYYGGSIND